MISLMTALHAMNLINGIIFLLIESIASFSSLEGATCTGARYYHNTRARVPSTSLKRSVRSVEHSSTLVFRDAGAPRLREGLNKVTSLKNNTEDINTQRESVQHPACKWCASKNECTSSHSGGEHYESDEKDYIHYQSECPLYPNYPKEPPDFLGDWMSNLMDISSFSSAPLSSLTLPGTHDSLSYDLSLTVSADGLDGMKEISKWLRKISIVRPNEIEEFMRLQAETQKLDIVQQLDNGIRFIDFRIAFEQSGSGVESFVESGSKSGTSEWYSIHALQSNQPAKVYLKLIRDWLEIHPGEIIVIWLSRRGNTANVGEDAYPNTPISAKRRFWDTFLDAFDGILFDTSTSDYRSTPMIQLLERKHRVVALVSDYEEFTNKSRYAYDAKGVINNYHSDCFNEEQAVREQREYFLTPKKDAFRRQWFYLKGMNTASNDWQVKSALRQRFLPVDLFDSCATKVNIPGNQICPGTVMDIIQLTNYYNQISIEEAYKNHVAENGKVFFPNAFYLDGLDYDGTLRTGTTTLFGLGYKGVREEYRFARYAIVDTVIGFSIHTVCNNAASIDIETCRYFMSYIAERRSKYPLMLWQEAAFGRHSDWPPIVTIGD